MGNSPSQQTAEGAQGEPEEFDLDAISDGSGDDDMQPKKKKSSVQVDGRSELGNRASSATTLKPSLVGNSPLKKLQSTKKQHQPLEDYDYRPPPEQDVRMKDPDETSSNDNSSNVIAVEIPTPSLQATRAKKTGASKRKRGPSIVEETPMAKPRKRRREKSSPTTSVDPAERELRQGSTTVIERPIGLGALERDAELASPEATPPPPLSLRLSLSSDVHRVNGSASEFPETEIPEDDAEVQKPRQERNLATSVAKRTFPFVVKKVGESSRNLQDEDGNSDDAFEDKRFSNSDTDSATATPAPRPTSKPKHKRLATVQKSGSALKSSPRIPASIRKRSQRNFDVEASDDANDTDDTDDKNDAGRPSSREKRTCSECGNVYRSRKLLQEHEKETGHVIDTVRTEVTGRFSEDEILKLEKYKSDFCSIHDIADHEFNDMMTDSCRRRVNQAWSHDIITKQDFLAQYFDVLPNRNRKSLARFRERNWQNATGSKDWTTEDDDQIIKLVSQIGTKWVEIGQALTRTQDAVHQRWKKYLQYRDTKKEGVWSPEESEILEKCVADAKTKSGLSQNPSSDKRIAWAVVSDALNGARTPKQCADHWQFVQESRGLKPRKRRKSKAPSKTPSKTYKRTQKKRRPQLSSPYVHDSENELEGDSHKQLPSNDSEDIHEDGDQDDQLGSPELPPILGKETPKKITTLSQAFANTQANTSALRRSQRQEPEDPSERPSPSLPSQAMVQLSAIQETDVDSDGEIAETEEAIVIQEPGTLQSTASSTSQVGDRPVQDASDSESEEESEEESDDDGEEEAEEERVVSPSKRKAPPSTEIASSRDKYSYEVEPGKEEPASDDDLQPLPELLLEDAFKNKATEEAPPDEDETSSSGDSDDTSDELETASVSDDDGSEDSMEKDARNDFMESIKQTARKAALAKQKKNAAPKVEESEIDSESESDSDSYSDSESDSDSDSDAESIAHG